MDLSKTKGYLQVPIINKQLALFSSSLISLTERYYTMMPPEMSWIYRLSVNSSCPNIQYYTYSILYSLFVEVPAQGIS